MQIQQCNILALQYMKINIFYVIIATNNLKIIKKKNFFRKHFYICDKCYYTMDKKIKNSFKKNIT